MEGQVTQYPYRHALVGDIFMELTREVCHDLEEELARKAKVRPDNHTVYKVVYDHGCGRGPQITYIWFHDSYVLFGREIRIERY